MKADVAPPPGVKRSLFPHLVDEVVAMIAFVATVVVVVPLAMLVTPFRVMSGWLTRASSR